METLLHIMSYQFVVRAFTVGILVSLCASLLGTTLVLRRYSMIGDGLSHVGFGALAVASALNCAPLKITIPIVVAAAFFLLRLTENSKIKGDSAIAVISTGALAIGVMIISVTTGMNTDLNNYLFGSILAMSSSDVKISIILSVIVLVVFIFFYNIIFSITFDERFAKATGISVNLFNMICAVLTAVTIVLGMRMMGSMLISSLIIFPSLTAMKLFKTFKSVTIVSAILSVLCFSAGLIISLIFSTPTGASIVIVNILMMLVFSAISYIIKK